ncbi:2-oxoglutarate dehydrogenase, E2 component, dihydrolipoamide succinyltransferase [Actinopolymorpha rutila]|uniref:Dihydrolipoamide acetyltransferase component of pyruvate dehydrogenase complex n=1 Tax=Actinopolymorpha rutila TaxID=446787 RepID=A0A852ZKG8_9ACTN|nr:2-oxoglutarate dehydrogenase, E2 component, dihydrolipoamide succinyltransferase [Actinopolymorpha rutila]NYH89690.1 2-oxoglutarate dehydrogenase E2 component (dihydrolipoamide succinyltransferase) [Actinopolymorpha rutila]
MPVSVTLPALGESVTEGTVTRWLKQVGETVQADEPLLEVSTDKVDTEIPAPSAGVLLQITVGEDETVEVGAELAVIGSEGEQAEGGGAHDSAQAEQEAEPEPAQEQEEPAAAEQEPAPVSANGSGGGSAEGTSVTLPALGESVTEGTVTRWLKQVGDKVEADEPLLEVSTDKVDTEIPAPSAGTLVQITVGEDETVEVGAELGVISTGAAAAPRHAAPKPSEPAEAEQKPAPKAEPKPEAKPEPRREPEQPAARQEPAQPAAQKPAAQPQRPAASTATEEGSAQYVTPLVRKLAAEHQVDLSSVTGSGVGGRIRKQDVLDAAKARQEAEQAASQESAAAQGLPGAAPAVQSAPAQPSPLRGTTEKLSRPRKVIAQRVHESLQNTAQLTTVVEVDVTAIARIRDRAKRGFQQREGIKLSFLPFFAKAALEALKEHPKLNASLDLDKGEVTYHANENLVIAVDTERGLMVPVIHDAGDLNVTGLAKRITDLAERTRTNKITPNEISGGTFTITNTGSRGALFDTPIFFQPQVAILGTGSVVKRPVVVDTPLGETIAIRHMVYLALSYDHRLIDGADAARFLVAVKTRLEDGSVAAEFSS